MSFTRRCSPLVIAGIAAAVALDAPAAGFSASGTSAVLGQPLDFAVQVRLQPGETLAQECVSAEVTVGERRLPPPLVRALLVATGTDTARIRVITDLAIDEPVVAVLLNAGCASARFTRRFVVLADPPIDIAPATAMAVMAAVPLMPAQALAPIAAPAVSPLASFVPTGIAASNAVAAVDSGAAPRAATAPASPRLAAPRLPRSQETPEARRAREAREARRTAQRLARAERRAVTAPTAAPRADKPAAEAAAPRLRLDAVEPPPSAAAMGVEAALRAVAEASSAARAAAAAASATAARIATLERTVAELRGESNAGRDGATELRTRLAHAEQASRWTTPLLALVLLLTTVAAWLVWRLNGTERARRRGWQTAGQTEGQTAGQTEGQTEGQAEGQAERQTPAPASLAALNVGRMPSKLPTAPIPVVNSEINLPRQAVARSRPAWPAPVSVALDIEPPITPMATQPLQRPRPESDKATVRTEPMTPRRVIEESAPRDVSIEELIDLEQQAEFFVVLGQDDAAVDLLVEHLRHTGGGSPLPYLKLLEIYRRRGRRAEYERLRERFNLRFNAYAPEWEADLQAGRTLDSYAGVIPRLQQVWPRPLDAMAELEALLFRKSRGDLFELPAYRDVLFLYSLARDLLDREAADLGQIDLLLPLADGGEFSSTSAAPYLALERDSASGSLDGKATAPVDFDLSSDPGRPASIFGPLDDSPAHTRRP